MSLLDSDNKLIKETEDAKGSTKSNRKAKNSGLNRFKSLNKYKKYADELRQKSDDEPPKVVLEEKPLQGVEETVELVVEAAPIVEVPQEVSAPLVEVVEAIIETPDAPPEINAVDMIEPEVSVAFEKMPEAIIEAPKQITDIGSLDNVNTKQTDNKQSTNRQQRDNVQVTPRTRTDNRTDNKTGNIPTRIFVPEDRTYPNPKMITGQKRAMLDLFFWDCRSMGSLETSRYNINYLAEKLNTTANQAKTQIFRLVQNGYLERLPGKSGRAGWVQFRIPQIVYDALVREESQNKILGSPEQVVANRITEQITKQITAASSSSSDLNINKTTTTESFSLSHDWQDVLIPENLKEIGFSRSHVIQVARDGFLTSDDLQSSLDAFSYDLSQGKVKASFGPLRLLMGVLRKQKMPYVSEALLEQERLALEHYQARRRKLEDSQKEIAAHALTAKFQDWWNGLSQKERNEYVPPTQFVSEGSEVQTRIALGIFLQDRS